MGSARTADNLVPTVWTPHLQRLTAACAIVFTIGTTIWLFIMISDGVLERSMRLAGMSTGEAEDAASTMLLIGVPVGAVYIVGNAVGMLALRGKPWVFWVAVAVNLTQGMGILGAVPDEIYQAVNDEYGWIATLPSLIVDGGGLILAVVLIASFLRFRTPWAQRRLSST